MRAREQRERRSERGFTLIELLVVLVILVLIGGLVGPQVLSYLGGARSDTAGLQMDNIASALDLYRLDNGRSPTEQEGLQALIAAPADALGRPLSARRRRAARPVGPRLCLYRRRRQLQFVDVGG